MTKKDYIKIAEILRFANTRSKNKERRGAIRFITDELIKVFQQDNIQFNPVKFSKAIYDEE